MSAGGPALDPQALTAVGLDDERVDRREARGEVGGADLDADRLQRAVPAEHLRLGDLDHAALLLAATDPDDVGELLSAVTASWAKGGRRR